MSPEMLKGSLAINLILRTLGRIMPPLYHFDLVSFPVGMLLAAAFFGLLTASAILAWRSSLLSPLISCRRR